MAVPLRECAFPSAVRAILREFTSALKGRPDIAGPVVAVGSAILMLPKNLKPRVPAPSFLRAYSAFNKNEYLRNTLDVRDGTDELHWFPAMAQGRRWSLIVHYSLNFRSLGFDLGAGAHR